MYHRARTRCLARGGATFFTRYLFFSARFPLLAPPRNQAWPGKVGTAGPPRMKDLSSQHPRRCPSADGSGRAGSSVRGAPGSRLPCSVPRTPRGRPSKTLSTRFTPLCSGAGRHTPARRHTGTEITEIRDKGDNSDNRHKGYSKDNRDK